MKRVVIFIVSMPVSGVFFLVSCSKDPKQKEAGTGMAEHGMAASWKFTLPSGDPVNGRKVFVELECYKCHEVKGEKFPTVAQSERGVGAELSQMAAPGYPWRSFSSSDMDR